jgi:plasmid maintenance system antidote protein VapI
MLKTFIEKSGHPQAHWAQRFGVSKSYLSELVNGNRRPSLDLGVRIEAETGGAVSCASWFASPAPGDTGEAA